jgi:hypothetical protein
VTALGDDFDRLVSPDDADRRRARAKLVLVVAACTMALASRGHAETLPPAVALVDEQTGGELVEDGPQAPKEPLPPATERNQLRLELGIGGPSGMIAVRYSRVLATRTRIEPAVGLGYTGVLGSLLVTHPLFEAVVHTKRGTATGITFELYGGYSASHKTDALEHPWTGRPQLIPNGTYHWIDFGLSTQVRWRALRMTAGGGVTKLLDGPAGIGGDNHEHETFWYFFPEGWFSRKQLAPAFWSSIGFAF